MKTIHLTYDAKLARLVRSEERKEPLSFTFQVDESTAPPTVVQAHFLGNPCLCWCTLEQVALLGYPEIIFHDQIYRVVNHVLEPVFP